MEKSKKIFIAGRSGFIGSSLVRILKERGYENILAPSRSELDLLDSSAVEDYFRTQPIDYVFLCAGKVGGIQANIQFPADLISQNLSLASNIINASLKSGVTKLLNLGSSCMYPYQASVPFKESDLFSGSLEPSNHAFAVSKLASYELCRAIYKQHNKMFITAIPTGLYGPQDHFLDINAHVIPSLMSKFWKAKLNSEASVEIWGSGLQKREFLFVDDCSEALVSVMNSYKDEEAINIGMGDVVSIKELAAYIQSISGFEGAVVFNESQPEGMMEKSLSDEKLKKINWSPKVSLASGLQKTWDWACENVFVDRIR